MNILRKFTCMASAVIALGMVSCDDFFEQFGKDDDMNPNDSTGISLPEIEYDIDTLLVHYQEIYPQANYGLIGELLSDNIVDNNSPNVDNGRDNIVYYELNSLLDWQEKLFSFEMTNEFSTDTDMGVYKGFQNSAKSAGLFIYAVDNIDASTAEVYGIDKLKSMQGEAYVIRSFANFILENFFAQSYVTGGNTMAMPYVNYPNEDIECTVKEAYDIMMDDLLKGMALMDEYGYPTSKFRFNKEAVYAYAARINLYMRNYDKVIQYADMVLGSESAAANKLRDFMKFQGAKTLDEFRDIWQNENEPSVFMMLDTYSLMMRAYILECRFALNSSAYLGSVYTFPTSGLCPIPYFLISGTFVNGKQEYGIFNSKIAETFLYIDEEAGMGYPKLKKIEFTAEETLLCRAEAKLFTGDFQGALSDVTIWNNSKKNVPGDDFLDYSKYMTDPDLEKIKQFYGAGEYTTLQTWNSCYYDGTVMSDMLSNFEKLGYKLSGEDETALMRFILHSRRLETIFDGLRFFDLKRFGIEYQHNVGRNGNEPANVYILGYDDPRRALRYDFIEEEPDTISSKGFAMQNLKLMHEFDYSSLKLLKH